MLISEQAVSPVSGSRLWVLVDDRTMAIHPQAAAWATFLRGAGRSPNTIRSYLPLLGRFLNWTSSRGLDWRRVTVLDLAGFASDVLAARGIGDEIANLNLSNEATAERVRANEATDRAQRLQAELDGARLSLRRMIRDQATAEISR